MKRPAGKRNGEHVRNAADWNLSAVGDRSAACSPTAEHGNGHTRTSLV